MLGCSTQQVLSSIGLTEKDLFNNVQQKPQIVAEYIYRDENGNPLYKVIRFKPKNFTQARYVNGDWIFKMTGARYVLYNLQNVIKSDTIYFVEGEKDADNLNEIGLVATTTVGGASGFNKHKEEYIKFLKNKKVYIIPDNDIAGYKYAKDIYKTLKEVAKEVKILKLANVIKDLSEKADISDVLNAYGKNNTLSILDILVKSNFDNDKVTDKEEKIMKVRKITHNEVAEILLSENSIAIFNNDLYVYINGVYKEDRKYIERKIIEINPEAKSHFREEVYKYLKLKEDIYVKFDKESGIINFKNGLYDIKKRQLYEHTSEIFSINQININFNENAKKIQAVEDFLNRISTDIEKRKQTILEMIGYCMTTSVKEQKAFILYGETARNGKSTLTNIITNLIGRENVGNVSFYDINNNRFAVAGIKGKLLNTGAEMTEEYLRDISNLKMSITGDDIEIEEKFKPREIISPYAKFIFNANTLPRVADKTNGFYRRLHIIPLETSFTDEDAKKFDINKLLTEEALEYLAKISVEAYLAMDGQFSNYEESDKEVNKYRLDSNSVLAFVNDKEYISNLYEDIRELHLATNVYKCYKDYCVENKWNPVGRNSFYDEIEKSKSVIIGKYNNQKAYTFII